MSESIFSITAADGAARTGLLHLPHGTVETPAFMPVGTAGTVKAMRPEALHRLGFRLILGNTYHLFLRPGVETIAALGGLHGFSSWRHNILTDSGGYQVFSLAPFRKISEEGVLFQSHIDGSRHTLTPESVVDIQVALNSDIQMVLDVCTGAGIERREAEEALDLTQRWAERAVRRRSEINEPYRGHLFGIVQGNFFPDLRRRAAEDLAALDFPGYAIGGLSVGETFKQYEATLTATAPALPEEKPRYVMGIGTPEYILAAIENGIDMFDCVFPTRAGRTGTLFTTRGRINIKNARFARDPEPPDPEIASFGGTQFSMAYLRHLFQSGEILGSILATEHNLRFMKWLVDSAGSAIRDGSFSRFKRRILEVYPP